jgi:hypothetical protein
MTIQARVVTLCAITGLVAAACDATRSSTMTTAAASASNGTDAGDDDDSGTGGADESEGGSTGGNDSAASTQPADSGGPADDDGGSGDGGEVVIDAENLIDDLEDGDAVIYARDGRQGAWYTYNDATAGAVQNPEAMTSFTPTAGGAPASPLFMAHSDGAGFAEWGWGMGIDLNNAGDDMGGPGLRMPYDGSAHTGIVFRARGDVSIRLKILVEAIVPADAGGTCAEMCEDAHGKIIALEGEWTQFVVPFTDLFQEGWGFGEVDLDPATLMSIQFQVAKSTDGMVEIDDVGFY